MSATQLYESSKQNQHVYKQAFSEYNKILKLFTTDGHYFSAPQS